jgi:hypothetical protein
MHPNSSEIFSHFSITMLLMTNKLTLVKACVGRTRKPKSPLSRGSGTSQTFDDQSYFAEAPKM